MERKKRVLAVSTLVATLLLCAFAEPAVAAKKIRLGVMTITGIVIELQKDKEGKVTSVGIQDEQQGKFVIARRPKGIKLMKLVNERVQVTGTVTESDGKKTIIVTDYKVLE
jgi:hypothetical protein